MKNIQNINIESLVFGCFQSFRRLVVFICLILTTQSLFAQNLHFSETEIINAINPYHSFLELENDENAYQAIIIHKKDESTIHEINQTRNWYQLLEKRPIQIDTKVVYYEKSIKKHKYLKDEYFKEVAVYIEAIDKTITKEVQTPIGVKSDTFTFHINKLEFIEILKPNDLAVLPAPYLEYVKNEVNPIYATIQIENTLGEIEEIQVLKNDKEKIGKLQNYEYISGEVVKIDTLTVSWIKRKPSRGCCFGSDCQVWALERFHTKTTDTIKIYKPKEIDIWQSAMSDNSVSEIFVFPTNGKLEESKPVLFDTIGKIVFAKLYEHSLEIHFFKNVMDSKKYMIQIHENDKVLISKIIKQ